jgi:hypothetical protein
MREQHLAETDVSTLTRDVGARLRPDGGKGRVRVAGQQGLPAADDVAPRVPILRHPNAMSSARVHKVFGEELPRGVIRHLWRRIEVRRLTFHPDGDDPVEVFQIGGSDCVIHVSARTPQQRRCAFALPGLYRPETRGKSQSHPARLLAYIALSASAKISSALRPGSIWRTPKLIFRGASHSPCWMGSASITAARPAALARAALTSA